MAVQQSPDRCLSNMCKIPWGNLGFVDESGCTMKIEFSVELIIVVDDSLSEGTYTSRYNSAVVSLVARRTRNRVHVIERLFTRKDAPY